MTAMCHIFIENRNMCVTYLLTNSTTSASLINYKFCWQPTQQENFLIFLELSIVIYFNSSGDCVSITAKTEVAFLCSHQHFTIHVPKGRRRESSFKACKCLPPAGLCPEQKTGRGSSSSPTMSYCKYNLKKEKRCVQRYFIIIFLNIFVFTLF